MERSFTIDAGDGGPRLVAHGSWSPAVAEAMRANRVTELELNYAKGWSGTDYSFLADLPALEALEITDWNAKDVSALNALNELRKLKVFTYCKTEIRFPELPRLEDCSLEWRPKASSMFQHRGIKKLFVNKCPERDLRRFSTMTQLASLSLASPKLESLEGAATLQQLTFLGVYVASRLTSLRGIEPLSRLRDLEVNDCRKVGSIEPLAGLGSLRHLQLCNDGRIDTLAPLAGLQELETFLFYESTDVADGDLTVLKRLPKLQHVVFMDRPHYSDRQSNFPRRDARGAAQA
ncbi:MAG: hypothetical protein ABUR63_07855 [Verrucomicrobiota bacterium]